MRELEDLINYVSPRKLRGLSYFFRKDPDRKRTLVDRLYEAISSNKVNTDQEANDLLFSHSTSSHYYKVKHDLRNQLLNSVLLIDADHKKRGAYYDTFINCRKELYVAEVLYVEGKVIAALDLLKKLLRRAIEAELTEVVISVLAYLSSYSVSVKPDETAYNRYQDLVDRWQRIRNAEEEISRLYNSLAIVYASSAAPPPEHVNATVTELKEIERKYPNVNTTKYIYHYYFVRYIIYDSRGDYSKGIKTCWDTIKLIGDRKYTPRGYVRNLLLQIIDASIRIRAFNDGQKAVLRSLRLVDEGDRPWFRINQLFLYLCIRTKDRFNAADVMNRVFAHKKFRNLPQSQRERWLLLRAYLSWWLVVDQEGGDDGILDKFRLGRFLNDVPQFQRDYLGFNVPVLIIQLLWLVQKKEYMAARKRLEGLRRYALRHLSTKEGLLRTFYFIRVLTQLGNASFHRKGFIWRAEPYYKELLRLPATGDLQSVEVEIIPYEDLYTYTLSLLDDKKH